MSARLGYVYEKARIGQGKFKIKDMRRYLNSVQIPDTDSSFEDMALGKPQMKILLYIILEKEIETGWWDGS